MVTKELLHILFEYDGGELTHKTDKQGHAKKGAVVGQTNRQGYRYTKIQGKLYLIHRLIWLMHNGILPQILDHKDGNRLNNKIDNLRESTCSQNHYNSKIRSQSTTGIKGITKVTDCDKWMARIKYGNKRYHLGRFANIEDAEKAVREKRLELHGDFACHG